MTKSLLVVFCLASLGLGGCKYVNQSQIDPADPVSFALYNTTTTPIYVDMGGTQSVISQGLSIRAKDETNAFEAVLSCDSSLCANACDVQHCAEQPSSVLEILPGESHLVEWLPFRFDPDSANCGGANVSCVSSSPAPEGRYTAQLCYSHALSDVVTRSASNPQVLVGAAGVMLVDSPTCVKPLDFGVPGFSVRYLIEVQ